MGRRARRASALCLSRFFLSSTSSVRRSRTRTRTATNAVSRWIESRDDSPSRPPSLRDDAPPPPSPPTGRAPPLARRARRARARPAPLPARARSRRARRSGRIDASLADSFSRSSARFSASRASFAARRSASRASRSASFRASRSASARAASAAFSRLLTDSRARSVSSVARRAASRSATRAIFSSRRFRSRSAVSAKVSRSRDAFSFSFSFLFPFLSRSRRTRSVRSGAFFRLRGPAGDAFVSRFLRVSSRSAFPASAHSPKRAVAARAAAPATSAALRPKRSVRAAVEATPAAAPWHRSEPVWSAPATRSETSLAAFASAARRSALRRRRAASSRRSIAPRSDGSSPRDPRSARFPALAASTAVPTTSSTVRRVAPATVPATRRASDSAAPALRGRSRTIFRSSSTRLSRSAALSSTRRPLASSTAVWTSRAAWEIFVRHSMTAATPLDARGGARRASGAEAAPRLGRSSLGGLCGGRAGRTVDGAWGAWGASAASFPAPLVTRDDTSGDSSRASAPVASWPVVEVPAEGRPSRAEDDPSATFDPSEDAEGAACPSDASSPRRVSAAPSGRSGRDAGEDISAVRRACGGSASARAVWRASAPPRRDRTHAFLKKSAQLCPTAKVAECHREEKIGPDDFSRYHPKQEAARNAGRSAESPKRKKSPIMTSCLSLYSARANRSRRSDSKHG